MPPIRLYKKNIDGLAIGESEFQNGMFVRRLDKLLAIPRRRRNSSNGADQIADFLTDQIMDQG